MNGSNGKVIEYLLYNNYLKIFFKIFFYNSSILFCTRLSLNARDYLSEVIFPTMTFRARDQVVRFQTIPVG